MSDTDNKTLLDKFGFAELSEEEKILTANEVGSLILESATLRFLAENDKAIGEQFSKLVETYADKDNLPGILIENFPSFGVVLEEEAEAFRKDAENVLSTEEEN